jgi:uncharacterized membrane protein
VGRRRPPRYWARSSLLLYQVLTGAITGAVATEVAGEDPGVEQSYRFGFVRLWSSLLVSILVGLATVAGLIVFIIPGIYIGVRLAGGWPRAGWSPGHAR